VSVATSYRPISDVTYNVATEFVWNGVSNGGAIRSAALEVANVISARDEPVRSAPSLCPTGRCTWSAYSSLAVCHRCQNLSHLLIPVCQKAALNLPGGSLTATNPCGYRFNTTLVTGSWGNPGYLYYTGLSTMVVGDRLQTLSDPIFWNSTVFQKAPHTLLDFYIGFVPGGDQGSRRNATPVLSECVFQWCVKTFEASHRDGRLVERVLSTYLPPDMTEVIPVNPNPDFLLGNAPNDPFVMMAGGNSFSVSANTTRRLRNSLNANLPVSLKNDDLDSTGQYPGRWNFVQNAPYDFDGILGSMAEAITNQIRTPANNGTEKIYGDAWSTETFVKTQWLWLLLPGTLLLGSLSLIWVTIIRSRKDSVPSWKSSALAILLHGLTEEVCQQFSSGTSQSEVEALSRKVRVKISLDNSGGKLVSVSSPPGHP
jgi:hypothetical protein